MVSIIIPNYNHAKYLQQRMDTILRQTYQDFEIILLDDCSTDASQTIIDSYKDHPKVSHVIYNKLNSGSTFKQWSKGLSYAVGKWVWIAESDDYSQTDFLEVMLAPKNDLYGLRFSKSVPVDLEGHILEDVVYPFVNKSQNEGTVFLQENLLKINYFLNASSAIIKTDLLRKILTSEISEYKLFGDWLVWCKACFLTDIQYVDSIKNFHRHHENSVRAKSITNGIHKIEFQEFRRSLKKIIKQSGANNKKELHQINNALYAKELGLLGCELIKQGRFLESASYIVKATIKLKLNLYYVRSAIYWMLNK